jgi:glycerate-2-kinase
MTSLAAEAREIFAATLRQLDLRRVVSEHIRLDGGSLTLGEIAVPLRELDRILSLAVGKAALPMVRGAQESLRRKERIPIRSIAVTNEFAFVAFYRARIRCRTSAPCGRPRRFWRR